MSMIPEPVPTGPAVEALFPFVSRAHAARGTIGFQYAGRAMEYFGVLFVNWALTLATLGFYYPWARTRELRFMIESLVAGGDALRFHGRGGELFWGVLRAWLLFVPPLVVLSFVVNLPNLDWSLQAPAVFVFYLLLLTIVSFAVIGSLRYRASRTSWHGIRFGFDGRFSEFGGPYVMRLFAVFLTLGLAYVHVATWRRNYMLSHARLGGERFGFQGVAADLFPRYLLCWLLTIPTFGLSLLWFHGHQQAYYWDHTTLAGGRFRSALTGGEWVGISLLNGLLVAFTFGLGAPAAYVNLHRQFFERLSLEGADIARIRAGASEGSGTGEGAAGLFDVDGGLDVG